jgi:SAM-dependent methyltransferase
MNVLLWCCTTLVIGSIVLVAGLRNASPTADVLQAGTSAVETAVGFMLLAFGGVGFLTRRTLTQTPTARLEGSVRTLFVVSFTALFVELMLIRYLGSQFRILAFYKNIALVGAFLGLGVGAALGRAGPAELQRFALWMVPIAGLLGGGSLWLDDSVSALAALVSEEHIIGDVTQKAHDQILGQLGMGVFCAAVFLVVAGQFKIIGRLLGTAFEGLAPRRAYTVNLAGSLAGVLTFLALCRIETPPAVWFLVGLAPLATLVPDRMRVVVAAAALGSAALVAPTLDHTVWSAYQKLVVSPAPWATVDARHPAQLVRISDVFYQIALDLRPEANERRGNNPYPHYDAAYAALPAVPERVLVVGAGTGNDVAAALRAGVDEVVAVDIDPAIVRAGALHPEQPYADPRVRVVIDDARRVLRSSAPDSYDAVIFGLLDSHTQLAGSSVRLDNYVFTQESLRDAWRVLRPGGNLVLTAACFDGWFVARFDSMLRGAFGPDQVVPHPPEAAEAWWQWIATKDPLVAPVAIVPDLPSDDWPFLYLPKRSIPRAYVVALAALALTSLGFVRAARLERSRLDAYHAHMFFLGAAFLLMETYAVNRLALLFGTTWIVSAVTIVLALVLVLLANVVSGALARIPVAMAYAGIAAGVIGASFVTPTALVGAGAVHVLYGILVLSPVFFAGFVFSRSFERASGPGAALGANILGSVLGGWTEYATMALGIQAMAWIALAFYACSAVCLGAQRRPSASAEGLLDDIPRSRSAVR